MRVPKNVIQTGLYTSGKEFVYKNTQSPYKGYYYSLNDSYYVGKEYKQNADELIKIAQSNTLLSNSSTALFSAISGITSQMLRAAKVPAIQSNIESNSVPIRYFMRQVNVQPVTIKEISKEIYESLQGNPLYQTTFVSKDQNIDQADRQLPGLKTFLSV
jgi:hypothetical protein